jgi:tRNA 2-thiocytidine biosynthesis protein TtcA
MPQIDSPPDAVARRVEHYLLRDLNRAVREFDMIRSGDRIAVAVSGGKDSLALLRLLQVRRAYSPTQYELAAVHVRGDATGMTGVHIPLEKWLHSEGVVYRIVEPPVEEGETTPLGCQRCTWLRRKAVFLAAEEMGCQVVAYAQHADDAAQTSLLNLLYGGTVATLAPCASYFGGHFRLIRPLIYVPEKELARLARVSGFPPSPPACPRQGQTARDNVAKMLKLLGRDYVTQARPNLIRAGLRGRAVTSLTRPAAEGAELPRSADCIRDWHRYTGQGEKEDNA